MRTGRLAFDIECYPNYFLIIMVNTQGDKQYKFEIKGEDKVLSMPATSLLKKLLLDNEVFGFNSQNYDLPMLFLALSGYTSRNLFDASTWIINGGKHWWETYNKYNINPAQFRVSHFDIMNVLPLIGGLKLYSARLHFANIKDLPFEVGKKIKQSDLQELIDYCCLDVANTIKLFGAIESQITLRRDLSKEYHIDFRSFSDAKIAEKIIGKKLNIKERGASVKEFKYNIELNNLLPITKKIYDDIRNDVFVTNDAGKVLLPKCLHNRKVLLGDAVFKIGLGGLHSQEKGLYMNSNQDSQLIDCDVSSYYPNIIIKYNLYPVKMGDKFLNLYKELVKQRLEAKNNSKDNHEMKIKNDALKIVINGTYGKLGNKWSLLYSPDLLIAVTITGQLLLLNLIEMLNNAEIRVISANTDGVVCYVDKDKRDVYNSVVKLWQNTYGFKLEYNKYKTLLAKDVNNYVAITESETKTKGCFSQPNLSKNPQGQIIYDSIVNFAKGISVEDTINNCDDIRKFVLVRGVGGMNKCEFRQHISGEEYKRTLLGKTCRFVWGFNETDHIGYVGKKNKVALSDGAIPIMSLKDVDVSQVNRQIYVDKAKMLIKEIVKENE